MIGDDLRIKELEAELKDAKNKIEELQSLDLSKNEFKNDSIVPSEEENLKESILDNLHYPLLILDTELKVIFANKIYKRIFSSEGESITGEYLCELGEKQWDIPSLRRVLESIIPFQSSMTNFEVTFKAGGSEEKCLLLNAKKINLKKFKKDYILLSMEDISERKKAINELKESEHRLREMIHSSNSLIAILRGPDMIIEIANDAIKKVWGKGTDVEGTSLFDLLPEIVDQGMPEIFRNVYETGEVFVAHESPIMHTKDGKMILGYFDFIYQAQRDSNGNIEGVSVIATEVTNQAILNKKIKKNEKEFRELVNFMPHKISLTDGEGNPIFYNESWLDYVGKTFSDFKEQSYTDIIHPDDRERIKKEVEKSLSNGADLDVEVRLQDKKGNYQWHISKATPVRDEDGIINSWITSSTEIQKLKEEEQKKEDFLKLVSHELKTPVTSIKGYVQLLLSMLKNNGESGKALPVKPYLNRIETQVERLIRLISEMLDLSRIEQNELELKTEKFNLNKHVEEIVEDLTYSNKNIKIELEHKYDCDVYADKGRIGQVIINFVTNALKYSPDSNRVNIKIYDHDNDQVAVSVKDFGIGISEKEQHQIFKRFYRVAGNKDDTYSGFGIGLYLSNEIIERHNGKIFVKSELGQGSEFTFTIPLNQN